MLGTSTPRSGASSLPASPFTFSNTTSPCSFNVLSSHSLVGPLPLLPHSLFPSALSLVPSSYSVPPAPASAPLPALLPPRLPRRCASPLLLPPAPLPDQARFSETKFSALVRSFHKGLGIKPLNAMDDDGGWTLLWTGRMSKDYGAQWDEVVSAKGRTSDPTTITMYYASTFRDIIVYLPLCRSVDSIRVNGCRVASSVMYYIVDGDPHFYYTIANVERAWLAVNNPWAGIFATTDAEDAGARAPSGIFRRHPG
ncbi:hypothetical protein B0H14DRAFT_3439753 [Mycena olivaceomarginata]|nr:hypothetical protein B0H14DRAFT_3439753 [Mycena olivaceomarginata]